MTSDKRPSPEQIATWKANRKAWTKALRSGIFPQGQRALQRNDGTYCCLGVLCVVAGLERIRRYDRVAFDGETTLAPPAAKDFVGLTSGVGAYSEIEVETPGTPGRHQTSLMALNDNGCSFEEIADVIDSCPRGLFLEGTE